LKIHVSFIRCRIKRLLYVLLYNTGYIWTCTQLEKSYWTRLTARPIWLFKLCTRLNIFPYCTVKRLITYKYCIVLYCIILYCIVLYCIVLYCIVLYWNVLYCTVLYCTVLYCTVLYCTVLYCTVLYCTVLYCTVLYCTVLYCTVLYCTVLYRIVKITDCTYRNQKF